MSSNGHDGSWPDQRKPLAELRHWATYTGVGEWYRDYRGYVPIQMPAGIERTMRLRGMTFPETYAFLLQARVIIHFDAAEDAVPLAVRVLGPVPARAHDRGGRARSAPPSQRDRRQVGRLLRMKEARTRGCGSPTTL